MFYIKTKKLLNLKNLQKRIRVLASVNEVIYINYHSNQCSVNQWSASQLGEGLDRSRTKTCGERWKPNVVI